MLGPRDWNEVEVAAIVADYFDMLAKELRGEAYNKTAHRNALREMLNDRSDASVERQHQNISAVLRDARFPWINGYKPLSNYQEKLSDAVLERLDEDGHLNLLALQLVDSSFEAPRAGDDILSRLILPPSVLEAARDALTANQLSRIARRRLSGPRSQEFAARPRGRRVRGRLRACPPAKPRTRFARSARRAYRRYSGRRPWLRRTVIQ